MPASNVSHGQPFLFRNASLAATFITGVLAEVYAASSTPDHALWLGGTATAFALLYLVWFWFSTTSVLSAVSGWIVRRKKLRVLLGFVLAAVLFAYVTSWGIYFQTGRFANWEAIKFTFFNWSMLQQYLIAADKTQIAWAAGIGLSVVAVSPFVVWFLGKSTIKNERLPGHCLAVWLLLSVAVLCTKKSLLTSVQKQRDTVNKNWSLVGDIDYQRKVCRIDRLSGCLNPAATVWASGIESWYTEPLKACLETQDLVPIDNAHQAMPLLRKRNVIIVAVESLRHDTIDLKHDGIEVLPNINRLAHKSVTMTRAYAQSTHSDYADVCLVSSLFPLRSRKHHFYQADDPWPRTLLHDVLKPHDYATAVISSQNEGWGGMDRFLKTNKLDWFYHPGKPNEVAPAGFQPPPQNDPLLAGKFTDRHTTDVVLKWIDHHTERNQNFYLSMNLQSSHFPYLIPDDADGPFQPSDLDSDIKFSNYRVDQVPIVKNAYFNAIHECDRQVGRLVDHLRKRGIWEDTILVVTGENGEAFHENGCIGHACNPNEPAIHVAAIISAPGLLDANTDDYPLQHVDLAPTIVNLLGMPEHPNFQGINVFDDNRIRADERLLYFHVLSPIARADAVSLGGRWKYMTSLDHPYGVLFDLETDPTESRDVSESFPEIRKLLKTALATWRSEQLAYYHFASYFEVFYPPSPPNLQRACALAQLTEDEVLGIAQSRTSAPTFAKPNTQFAVLQHVSK